MKIYEPKDQFIIEEHFKQYVSAMYNGMQPKDLHPTQEKVCRETFFSAWGQCLLFLRDTISEIKDDDEATLKLHEMLNQVRAFITLNAKRK